jgi:VWFA-related protein
MTFRRVIYFVIAGMLSVVCFRVVTRAQEPTGAIIRTETKLVLVDAVVTDKKGNYVHNLTAKDFHVYEDNKEQAVKSFSFEADPAAPTNSQPRYTVLFFDNSTMDISDQARARQAAVSFIQANAGPNRLMAIVNFGGSVQVAQNFTSDVERLKAVASGLRISSVNPNESIVGQPGLSQATFDYGVRDVVLGLRSLVKNLAAVPGRKTLIFLTSGFPVNGDLLPEVNATIDVCNRSNVAIYPIDVRGLVPAIMPSGSPRGQLESPSGRPVSFVNAFFQRSGGSTGGGTGGGRGGGGGSGGGTGGGPRSGGSSSAGGRGNNTATSPGGFGGSTALNPNPNRSLIPPFPNSATSNQEIIYMLANGTGGFVIVNTNDLLGGLEKIGKEQNEFYLIGYTPPDSEEGSCHNLKVKVSASGASVRARTGYCSAKSNNALAKTQTEKTLEARVGATATGPGNVTASMEAPFFYTSANVARVNIAMEIATGSITFEKEKGKFHSVLNMLGIAYKPDGSVGARFSDKVNFEFETKKEVEAFQKTLYHYENQFDVASGKYKLKVAFSSGGENFGNLERQLVVEPYESKQFAMSALTFSTKYLPAAGADSGLDAELLADRTPLISQGVRLYPSGTHTFKMTQKPALYVEVYEPFLLAPEVPKDLAVAIQVKVLGQTTGEQRYDSGLFRVPVPEKGGNPVIRAATQVPIASLGPGAYRLIVEATDSKGQTRKRWTDFAVE